ncbi:rod shape-determining protein [Fodinisporobacter ferrooxydans]|uniref:Rod shape-determining protein n=1 Tax=Fodinisporobacter ferrooxydans TaxID=2901836 RepID=A0ABY4CII8_9BACL|nr:rod shape-determining protein [Alicyclobacillaceae bacterium MYW30-H2]
MRIVMDLGTCEFRAGMSGQKEFINESSVVARDQSGQFIVGNQAEQMLGRNPHSIQVGFPVVGGIIKDMEAAREVVKHAVSTFRSRTFGKKFSLTLSIPSQMTQIEKRALQDAGAMAGANHVELFDSSIAAAIGAGLPMDTSRGYLIVNLGAGVTEVSLLSMGGIVQSKSVRTGSRSIDEGLVETARKQFQFLIGQRSAERLKHMYGEDKDAREFEVRGRSLTTGLPDSLNIPRSVVEELFNRYYESIHTLILHSLEAAPPELVGDILDHGMILVGGGAKATDLQTMILKTTEIPVIVADEPDTCIIRGLLQTDLAKQSGKLPWKRLKRNYQES